MKNNRIKLDKKELSDNDILKHKNFDKVINSVNIQPNAGFNGLKFWAISGSVTFVAAIIIFSILNANKTENADLQIKNDTTENVVSYVNPPIPEIDIPYEIYSIDNSKDTNIISETGSVIYIPADAFTRNHDKKNIVKIKYREFHNPYDIFASGIPMNYDSLDKSFTFESAGMLEFLAYQDAKPIKLKKGKELIVDMISDNDKTDFNLYKFDKESGKWNCKGKDIVKPISEVSDEVTATENNDLISETTEFSNPIKPILLNKQKYSLEIDVNNQSSDIIDVNNVLFEVDESKCNFKPSYFATDWENIEINKLDDKNFELKLSKNEKTVNLVVYPVYSSKNYKTAIAKYNQIIDSNKKQKAKVLKNRKHAIDNNIKELSEQIITDSGLKPWTYRRISLSSLGIWNCDKAILPKGTLINPKFVDKENNKVINEEIYIVERGKNQLIRFFGTAPAITVNTNSDIVMWTLTEDNKIAIINKSSINDIKESDRNKLKTLEIEEEYDNLKGCKIVKDLIEGKTDNNLPEEQEITVKTYPNPFTNKITIDLSNNHECIVNLLNNNGQILDNIKFKNNKYTWNLNNYKSGNYIIVVIIPEINYKKSFKIIKN